MRYTSFFAAFAFVLFGCAAGEGEATPATEGEVMEETTEVTSDAAEGDMAETEAAAPEMEEAATDSTTAEAPADSTTADAE